jgi:hypothetical protein
MKRFSYLSAIAAFVVLATGAATASGGTRPDDRATHGPGAIAAEGSATAVRPDDRATHGPGIFDTAPSSTPVRPDDRAWRGVGPAPTVEVIESPSVRIDGFDWADAGIGAAAALGLGLLVAGGSALALRRQRTAFS